MTRRGPALAKHARFKVPVDIERNTRETHATKRRRLRKRFETLSSFGHTRNANIRPRVGHLRLPGAPRRTVSRAFRSEPQRQLESLSLECPDRTRFGKIDKAPTRSHPVTFPNTRSTVLDQTRVSTHSPSPTEFYIAKRRTPTRAAAPRRAASASPEQFRSNSRNNFVPSPSEFRSGFFFNEKVACIAAFKRAHSAVRFSLPDTRSADAGGTRRGRLRPKTPKGSDVHFILSTEGRFSTQFGLWRVPTYQAKVRGSPEHAPSSNAPDASLNQNSKTPTRIEQIDTGMCGGGVVRASARRQAAPPP